MLPPLLLPVVLVTNSSSGLYLPPRKPPHAVYVTVTNSCRNPYISLPLRRRLTYWVVFAAFSILEAFLSVLLHWIPFYFALKLAFLAWCFLPQTQVCGTCVFVCAVFV